MSAVSDTPEYQPPPGPPPVAIKYAPPPGPPPGRPCLVQFPFLRKDQLTTLYTQGYARLCLPPDHPLLVSAMAVFAASREFFAKPSAHKERFHLSSVPGMRGQGSDEGWSRVEGEKEMITVRRSAWNATAETGEEKEGKELTLCPPEMVDNVRTLWGVCGDVLKQMMKCVEKSLGLEEGKFDGVLVEECKMPAGERRETMLRMFRYERSGEGEKRLVAAKHRDIGLLSLVVGSSPGLEVWDGRRKQWVAVEEDEGESGGGEDDRSRSALTVTLLTGMTLTRLTNNRYKPGVHRVFVPSSNGLTYTEDDRKYRYSIVFALRPHRNAIISTSSLTSDITGEFEYPLEGVKAQDLFNVIANVHWNVNGEVEEREAQRKSLQERREMATQAFSRLPMSGV